MHLKVSVIVPTLNGAMKISKLINALQSQTFQDFELIVAIDGSTDQTREVVAATETKFSKIIFEQPNMGRAIIKNNGAKLANGDLLIFYDDDMEPKKDSVQKHMEFHERHSGILSGNILEAEADSQPDIQNYKSSLTKKWIAKYDSGITQLTVSSLFFSAANCSISKDHFFSLRGFDERLRDAEDYDLALRAVNSGIKIYFDKSNSATHYDSVTCKGYIKRQREYNEAQQKVNSFHPELKPFTEPPIGAGRKLIYAVFSLSIFWKIIDTFNVFMLFPKKIRYRLYDIIIYSHSKVYPNTRL